MVPLQSAVEDQAIARLYRMGQTRHVTVYRLLTKVSGLVGCPWGTVKSAFASTRLLIATPS